MKTALTILAFLGISVLVSSYNIDLKSSADFKSVKIGKQEWMTENLNTATFRNGDPIPEAKTNEEWLKAYRDSKPAWCYYNSDPENGNKYGKLYNWYAVNDPRGIAPAGWHVPSNDEWTELADYLGGYNSSGSKMKSTAGWEKGNNGNNSSGFTGLPGGFRRPNGTAMSIGQYGYWWSSSAYGAANAWDRVLYYNNTEIRSNHHRATGCSVRCVKD